VFDPERKALVSRVKSGINSSKDLVLPLDHRSIAGYVAATKTTVRIDNLDDTEELKRIDPQLQFFNRVDGVTGFKSRQMLAAPLLQGPDKTLVGVLQLINQRADGRFDKVAEEGVEALTATLALALSKRMQAPTATGKNERWIARQASKAQDRLDFAKRLQALTNKIHGTDNVAQIMVGLSAEISELFNCERVTLYVHDKERRALVSRVKSGIDSSKDLVLPLDPAQHRRLCRRDAEVPAHRRPRRLPRKDETYRSPTALLQPGGHVTGFKSRQMLAAPLLHGPLKELVGVLQLINQRSANTSTRWPKMPWRR
jgi:GAF domain-containing protein